MLSEMMALKEPSYYLLLSITLALVETEEILSLRTIRQEIVQLTRATVSFQVSGMTHRRVKYDIHQAFTVAEVRIPTQPVHTGPVGGPVAVCTMLFLLLVLLQ